MRVAVSGREREREAAHTHSYGENRAGGGACLAAAIAVHGAAAVRRCMSSVPLPACLFGHMTTPPSKVRLNGENPAKDFQPCPGVLGEVVFPTFLDGVRVDSWVESGTEISPYYDSLLGKLMVYAPTRELAVKKIQEALAGWLGVGWLD